MQGRATAPAFVWRHNRRMKTADSRRRSGPLAVAACLAAVPIAGMAQGGGTTVYRCPGNVYTSDRDLSRAQAEQRGCKAIEGAPVTIVQTVKPPSPPPAAASAPRPANSRVDPAQQKARDDDRRAILNAELQSEQQKLADLQREYNNGQPERRGDERNYQRYLDRVAEMKASLARKEADIAALKRELDKLPQ